MTKEVKRLPSPNGGSKNIFERGSPEVRSLDTEASEEEIVNDFGDVQPFRENIDSDKAQKAAAERKKKI